jgi:hypothetical protein
VIQASTDPAGQGNASTAEIRSRCRYNARPWGR